MPPFILFVGKRIPKSYNPLEGRVPGSVYCVTEKGYMDRCHMHRCIVNKKKLKFFVNYILNKIIFVTFVGYYALILLKHTIVIVVIPEV